jgi:hypothetical protein
MFSVDARYLINKWTRFWYSFSVLGIEVLLEEGVYEAAYPLHDQLVSNEDAGEPETWNDRMVDWLSIEIIVDWICF